MTTIIIKVESVGVHFGCIGKVFRGNEKIAETDIYPFDQRAAAKIAAAKIVLDQFPRLNPWETNDIMQPTKMANEILGK